MWGLDHLGIAKYGEIARQSHPNGWALGAFGNTFGDSITAVKRVLSSGKCPRVRIHAMWKDSHNYSQKDFPAIEKELKRWRPVVAAFPHIEWAFSGACEHHLSIADSVKLADLVLNVHPDHIAVNVGDHNISVRQTINEVHGTKARVPNTAYNFSFDGSACVDSDVETLKDRHESAETFFFWEPRFNGRWETNDTTPRPKRKGWPTRKLISSVIALAEDCGEVGVPGKWIYKSHAENKGTGDPRAETALFISPVKSDAVLLKDGSSVKCVFKYYGPYTGGGYRYYTAQYKWGYEIARKPLSVWINGKRYGVVNPVFRCGSFR